MNRSGPPGKSPGVNDPRSPVSLARSVKKIGLGHLIWTGCLADSLNQKTAMPPRKKQQTLPAYSIVDPKDYMSTTVWVPGAIFGDFADTEE